MEREYKKNIYIRKIRKEPIYGVYEAAISSVYSKNIVEEVIDSLCRHESEHDVGRFLDLITTKNEDVHFRRKSHTPRYIDILVRIPISKTTFDSVYKFFKSYGVLERLDPRDYGAISTNFFNFFIYKSCTDSFTDDARPPVDLADPLQHKLFVEHYFRVVRSAPSAELRAFVDTKEFPDKSVFLHMLGDNNTVDARNMYEKYLDHVNPLCIQNIDHRKYTSRFLCFLQERNSACNVCGRSLVSLGKYFDIKHDYFTAAVDKLARESLDFTDLGLLAHFMSHKKEFCTTKNLKEILNFALQSPKEGSANLRLLPFFPLCGDNESMVIDALKVISKSEKECLKALVFGIAANTTMTERVIFGVFTIVLEMSRKHHDNKFYILELKNFVFRHCSEFDRVMSAILEYFFESLKEMGLARADFLCEMDRFTDLWGYSTSSDFFDLNMILIFPIIVSRNLVEFFEFTDHDILNNLPYLIIGQIVAGKEIESELLGYCVTDIVVEFGAKIISYLLVLDHSKVLCLEKYIGGVIPFFERKLTPILFKVRKIYVEQVFLLRNSIYDVLKFITQLLKPNLMHHFTHLFPFIEFFISKKDEQSGFIDWFYDQLDAKLVDRYSYMIFPYLSLGKLCHIKDIKQEFDVEKCVTIGNVLMNSKGLYGKAIALEKISHMLRILFGHGTGLAKMGSDEDHPRIDAENARNVAGGVKKTVGAENAFSDASFIRSFIAEFKRSTELRVFVQKFLNQILNSKITSVDVIEMVGLLGSIEVHQRELQSKRLVLQEITTEEIAKVLLDDHLFKIDAYNQDIHFFVIQETLKYVPRTEILDTYTQELVTQFRSSRYFLPLNFEYEEKRIYEQGIKFSVFIKRLLDYVLHLLQRFRLPDFFQLLQYGQLLSTDTKEFYVLCGIRVLFKHSFVKEMRDRLEEIIKGFDVGVDRRISEFFLKAYTFTRNEMLEDAQVLKVAASIHHHYHSVFILERIIAKNKGRKELWDDLLYNSYSTGDIDSVTGINSIFNRLDSVNLFYSFCVEKNFALAACCLDSADRNFETMTKVLTRNIENEESLIKRFLETCRRSACNLKRWSSEDPQIHGCAKEPCKAFDFAGRSTRDGACALGGDQSEAGTSTLTFTQNYKTVVLNSESLKTESKLERLHFLKDLELISTSNNFELVFERLKISKNVSFSKYENLIKILKETDSYDGLETFERKLKLLNIKNLRIKGEIDQAIAEITKMLIRKEWWVLYEHSKVLIAQNKKVDAKTSLKRLLALLPDSDAIHVKGLILQARLSNSGSVFEETLRKVRNSEKLFYYQGKYFEKIDAIKAMESYKNSLHFGSRFSKEIIPLIFHLFCEESGTKKKVTFYKDGKRIIEEIIQSIPAKNTFLPFFSQIIPKVSHARPEVVEVISKIAKNLFNDYPFLTFWDSLIFINSAHQETARRLEKITDEISFESKVILRSFKTISNFFVDISQYPTKATTLSFSKHFKKFLEFLPAKVSMPSSSYSTTIEGVGDEIQVFSSLQSPKRIELVGKDGSSYLFLCKPNDDLRKDNRFMDLASLLNDIFLGNFEYKENMKIRRYNVIPITHKNGIIEWISGLKSLKTICDSYYRKENILITSAVQKFKTKKKIGVEKYAEVVKAHPPVFRKWFEDEFIDPRAWFKARRRYIQTYAVMNGIGWFMGLGDRHCENIMFDTITGDTVHVDLNCLFERGKNFEVPETVPFRLTQNIVNAFGVLETEGTYRKALELTLKMVFERKDLIIANLLSFLYDPLFEWNKKLNGEQIIQSLKDKSEIDDVQEKADELIRDATSEINLSNMYIGWLSFV